MAKTLGVSIGTLRVRGPSSRQANAAATEFQALAGEIGAIGLAQGNSRSLRLDVLRGSTEGAGEAARRALAAHFGTNRHGR
jgi:hypothetical protein